MAKCTVFSFRDELTMVVEDGLYMRALVGDALSVGVVKFVGEKGAAIPAKAHSHGEEVSLQISGGCEVLLGDVVKPGNPSVNLAPGVVMIMPADQPHYGVNAFGAEGISWRLNVVTPPRQEFGVKGKESAYYPIAEQTT